MTFNDILKKFGFSFGQVLIGDLILSDVYFSPYELKKNSTSLAIDGDRNQDIDVYTKIEQVKYNVKGFFQSDLDAGKSKYEELERYLTDKPTRIFNFTGTPFDDKDFILESINRIDEGINFTEFSFVAKEMNFAEVKQFTTENKNIPGINKGKKVGGLAKVKDKVIPPKPY